MPRKRKLSKTRAARIRMLRLLREWRQLRDQLMRQIERDRNMLFAGRKA